MALISCKDLIYGYNGEALTEALNFDVEPGDYLCIVGENGAGKSTLMKTLLHLRKPISGSIKTGSGLREKEIGYVPQQTLFQRDFPASVREIVLSGCQAHCGLRPFYNSEEKALAEANIEKLGLGGMQKRCYRELSGGQQKRVLIARALCAGGKLLMLDEPTAGLDPKLTEELYRIIAELNRREGITVVMISHDIRAALCYADHILHIGSHSFYGSRDEYLKSPAAACFTAATGGAEHDGYAF